MNNVTSEPGSVNIHGGNGSTVQVSWFQLVMSQKYNMMSYCLRHLIQTI